MSALYTGIDVSKDFFTAQAIDGKGNKCFYLELAMSADGFDKLLKPIMAHGKDIAQVTVAMESTGCYHINLFSFLTHKGIRCVIINPLLTANFARLSLRKVNTLRQRPQGVLVHFDHIHSSRNCGRDHRVYLLSRPTRKTRSPLPGFFLYIKTLF